MCSSLNVPGRHLMAIVFLASVFFTFCSLSAEEKLAPRAAALLDKYVEVTGGEAAYDAVKTRIIQGQLVMPARNVEASMTTYFVLPGKFYTEIRSVAGVQARGCNGSTVWMIEPVYKARILRGAERVSMLRDSTPDRFGHWRTLADKVSFEGEEEVDGRKCAKVQLTYKPLDPDVKEPPVLIYFDLETGLINRYTATMVRPQIYKTVTVILDDYRKVDGLLLPFKQRLFMGDIESHVTLTSVQNNVPVSEDLLKLPTEIQKLWVQGR